MDNISGGLTTGMFIGMCNLWGCGGYEVRRVLDLDARWDVDRNSVFEMENIGLLVE